MNNKDFMHITVGKARFSVITENLIRCEWSENGVFCDAETLFAVNRRYNGCAVRINRTESSAEIKTEAISLYYRDNGENSFSFENLRGEVFGRPWHFGMKNENNLGGALATLDGVDGERKTNDGILSRSGWFTLDDSEGAELENGWLKKSLRKRHTDFYLFGYGTNYKKALQTLFYVSGPAALPRRYMLGAWYSRWWAYTDEEILGIADEYEKNGFPLDVMVLDMDWHHHDWTYRGTEHCKQHRAKAGYGHATNLGWTGYTWNRRLIKDPCALIDELHRRGIAVTLNDHPHDGVRSHEDTYPDFMRKMGLPPESGVDLEFDAGDRRYMEALFSTVHGKREAEGVDFWWVDWQQDHLKPVIRGTRLSHLPWLNRCYYQHSMKNGRRGASFSRFGGIGDHKHPICFSGDTKATWECLAFEVAFTASSSNAGLFYWGHDTGGFFGEANAELYVRWTQFSGFSACLRAHSERNAKLDRRPWKWGEQACDAMRKIYRLRARLMPYIYSLAYEGYANGEPMIAAMYLNHPKEENAYLNPGQYRFGKAFLCAPVTTPMGENGKAAQKIWIPDGTYYHFFTGERFGAGDHIIESPLDEFPLLVRAGVPIPMQPCMSRMSECAAKELTVRCYAGASGEFTLYEDDGISQKYEDGEYLKTKLVYREENDTFTLTVTPEGHGYRGMPTERNYVFELIGAPEGLRASENMSWDGKKYTVRSSEMNWNEAFTLSLKKENQP